MYDCWWPHVPSWGIDSLNRTVFYYRLPISMLLGKVRYLRTEEYSDAELAIHRPDLPFAFAKSASLEWPMSRPSVIDDLPNGLIPSAGIDCRRPSTLDTPKIYLSPFGPKGSSKPGVLVEAENGKCFTVEEMFLRAAQLQSQYLRETKVTSGAGIYRLGIQRKLPSYYIWGGEEPDGSVN